MALLTFLLTLLGIGGYRRHYWLLPERKEYHFIFCCSCTLNGVRTYFLVGPAILLILRANFSPHVRVALPRLF